jgi:hypothetical protein
VCRFVDNTVEGYRDALTALIADDAERERLGRRGRDIAQARWSPEHTEARFADIYRRTLGIDAQVPSAS